MIQINLISKIEEETHLEHLGIKEQRREYQQKYYYENRERLLEQKKEYLEKNRELINEKAHERYVRDRDKILAREAKYRENNKDKINAAAKDYYWRTIDKQKQYREDHRAERKKRYEENKEEVLRKDKEYREAHAEEIAARKALYYQKNKKKIHERVNKKGREDPATAMSRRMRTRLITALREQRAGKTTHFRDYGYTSQELADHLASLFLPGMSWENRDLWHIDHIKPISSYDLSDPAQVIAANQLSNLRPLWAKDNLRKHKKLIEDPMEVIGIKKLRTNVTVTCGDLVYTNHNYKVYTFKDKVVQALVGQDAIGYIRVGSDNTPAAALTKQDLEAGYDPNIYTTIGASEVTFGVGTTWTKDIEESDPAYTAAVSYVAPYYLLTLTYTRTTELEVFQKLFKSGHTIKVNPSPVAWDNYIIRNTDDSTPGSYVIYIADPGSALAASVGVSPLKPQYGRGDYYTILGSKTGAVDSNVFYDIPNYKIQVNTSGVAHEVNPGDYAYIRSTTNPAWELTGSYTVDSIATNRKSFVITVPATLMPVLTANPALLVVSDMEYLVGTDKSTTAVVSFTWFDAELSTTEGIKDNTGTGLPYGEMGLYSKSGAMIARFVLPPGLTKTSGHHLSVLWKLEADW